jgi:hypothetical protein
MSGKRTIDPIVIGIVIVIIIVASVIILRKEDSYVPPEGTPFVLRSSSGSDSVVVINTQAIQDSLTTLVNLGIISESQKDSVLRHADPTNPALVAISRTAAYQVAQQYVARHFRDSGFPLEPSEFIDYGDGRCLIVSSAVNVAQKTTVRWSAHLAFHGGDQADSSNWTIVKFSK